jgi:hypothetical protein
MLCAGACTEMLRAEIEGVVHVGIATHHDPRPRSTAGRAGQALRPSLLKWSRSVSAGFQSSRGVFSFIECISFRQRDDIPCDAERSITLHLRRAAIACRAANPAVLGKAMRLVSSVTFNAPSAATRNCLKKRPNAHWKSTLVSGETKRRWKWLHEAGNRANIAIGGSLVVLRDWR